LVTFFKIIIKHGNNRIGNAMKEAGKGLVILWRIFIGILYSGDIRYESYKKIIFVVNRSCEVQNTVLLSGKGLVPSIIPTKNWLSMYFFVWHLGATQKDWKYLCLS
jgi:hypothetical protein